LNTHFDHIGEQARIESTKLIARLAESLTGRLPVIVTGDFNYTKKFSAYPIIAARLHDAEQSSTSPPQGGDISFNGFGKSIEPGNKIDFIFVNGGFEVLSHRVITDLYQGNFPSDHYPIQARLRMTTGASR
jgi:endonuclease/exonuclease/phosphatase family metal-dependent hydrolase